eukprot:NODE_3227_length_813_cov_263.120053.p1 GENE.NODE_3227_length_813_cov_263.120053~~NODE_3227_length_813_cov_263.120053.p1  ORF type:complete len:193 (+),score=25.65 NODE_3227_length_813_cov_263.120053:141-719(+)
MASIESAAAIATGRLVELSEQELVDCSVIYDNNGCNGGKSKSAMAYVHDFGACTGASYLNRAEQGSCQNCKIGLFPGLLRGFKLVVPNSIEAMKSALQSGPVNCGVSVDRVWQHYKSGIADSPAVPIRTTHSVCVVGYDEYGGVHGNGWLYWKTKNSWGAHWGMNGYIYFTPTSFGVLTVPLVPVVGGQQSL